MTGLTLANHAAPKSSAPVGDTAGEGIPPVTPDAPAVPGKAKAKARSRTWRNVVERVLLPLIIGGAVYLVWWGLERLRHAQQQSAMLTQQVSKLSTDLELMQGKWPESKVQEVNRLHDEVTGSIFMGAPAVSRWGEMVVQEGVRRALDVQVRFTGTRTNVPNEKSFTIMRARLEIRPASGVESGHPVYLRLLDFVDYLVGQTQRVDLVELKVQGGSGALRRAQAQVDLWGTDELPSEVTGTSDDEPGALAATTPSLP